MALTPPKFITGEYMGSYQTRQLRITASKTQDTLFTVDFDAEDVAGVSLLISGKNAVHSYPTTTRDGYARHNILIPHELIQPHAASKTIPAELWECDPNNTKRKMWTGFIKVKE